MKPLKIYTESELNRQLSSPLTGYLFFGDEDYTKSHALTRLREAVCPDPSAGTFNDIRFTSLDFSPSKLLDALEPPPLLGSRKIISVTGLDFNLMRPDEISTLCDVLALLPDYDYNTVVISVPEDALNTGRLLSRPSPVMTKLCEHLAPVRFNRITPARLCGWVAKHYEFNKTHAEPEICAETVSYCGTSMYTLASEINKVSFYALANGRSEICKNDIYEAALPDTDYDAFSFANALTDGNRRRALDILAVMKKQRIEPTIIMGDISKVFCDMLSVKLLLDRGLSHGAIASITKIHEYRVSLYASGVAKTDAGRLKKIIAMCTEADLSVKMFSKGYEPVEKLICAI